MFFLFFLHLVTYFASYNTDFCFLVFLVTNKNCDTEFGMTMEDIDLKTFEKRLDEIIDQVAGESVDLIIERPRYIHAVMVIAEDDDEGQIIQVSCIKIFYV